LNPMCIPTLPNFPRTATLKPLHAATRSYTLCNSPQLIAKRCDTLRRQRHTVYLKTLQHTATHCISLQLTASRCITLEHIEMPTSKQTSFLAFFPGFFVLLIVENPRGNLLPGSYQYGLNSIHTNSYNLQSS